MTVFSDEFEADAIPDLFAEFGEVVTLTPYGDDPITLTAMVPCNTDDRDLETSDSSVDVLEVTILRDPSSSYGGLADVTSKMTLVRTESEGSGSNPYAFTGTVIEKTDKWHILKFERDRITRLGRR